MEIETNKGKYVIPTDKYRFVIDCINSPNSPQLREIKKLRDFILSEKIPCTFYFTRVLGYSNTLLYFDDVCNQVSKTNNTLIEK